VALPIAGIIEGFYGPPWSWDHRLVVSEACAGWGMRDYVYAPKDDPKHRDEWRVPYDDAELGGFARLAGAGSLRLGVGISPGLSLDMTSTKDRKALRRKVDQLLDAGASLIVLGLDDIPFGGGDQGQEHAATTTWLREHVGDRARVALVPTEYVGGRPTPYLNALAEGVPDDVPIAWTGDAVVVDTITANQARARASALGGRPPLVWDNVPVNDALMADRLHLGPLWGRDDDLLADGTCAGWLANPLVQPMASLLPLASVAAWLRGGDPLGAWADEAERRGWRTLAEACDGTVPAALVADAVDAFVAGRLDDGALEPLTTWFSAAAGCEAPGLEGECEPWLTQARREAKVGVAALELVRAALDPDDGGDQVGAAFTLGLRWRRLLAADVSVMGTRLGFRPALGQALDGTWAFRRSSVMEGTNAVDALCRLAFDALAWAGERG
jgi:hyaluronoglucosaminidase